MNTVLAAKAISHGSWENDEEAKKRASQTEMPDFVFVI